MMRRFLKLKGSQLEQTIWTLAVRLNKLNWFRNLTFSTEELNFWGSKMVLCNCDCGSVKAKQNFLKSLWHFLGWKWLWIKMQFVSFPLPQWATFSSCASFGVRWLRWQSGGLLSGGPRFVFRYYWIHNYIEFF